MRLKASVEPEVTLLFYDTGLRFLDNLVLATTNQEEKNNDVGTRDQDLFFLCSLMMSS